MTDEPSAAERAAVDELLGAQAGWFAGETARTEADRHVAFGGYHMSQQHRHLLLPALHALQSEIGWISKGGLNYVCRRLGVPPAEAFSVASFYALFTTNPRSPRVAHICDDIACKAAGAEAVIAQIGDDLGGPGAEDGQATWLRSPCLGMCEQAPVAFFQLTGDEDAAAGSVDATTLMSVLAGGEISTADPAIAAPQTANGDEGLRILRRIGAVDPDSLDSYRAAGGYAALARAVAVGSPQVVDEVKTSRIRGRGGAAFPMGIKWEAVAAAPEEQRYVICNADESEPGTFKDRVLMEHDPFAVVEAMTIAGYATGSDYGYLYSFSNESRMASTIVGSLSSITLAWPSSIHRISEPGQCSWSAATADGGTNPSPRAPTSTAAAACSGGGRSNTDILPRNSRSCGRGS